MREAKPLLQRRPSSGGPNDKVRNRMKVGVRAHTNGVRTAGREMRQEGGGQTLRTEQSSSLRLMGNRRA